MKSARVPVNDEVYVAIRKDGDGESADLGSIAFTSEAARHNAEHGPEGTTWKRLNPVTRVARCRLVEER